MTVAAILALLAAHASVQNPPAITRQTPRTILAVYNGLDEKDVRDTRIHRLLEMPLNHLGLVVTYYDVNRELPALDQMRDVRGIITWFRSDAMQRPVEFLSWADAGINAGKRFVIIGGLSAARDLEGRPTPPALINRFLARLGLRIENWTPVTYDVRVLYKDPAIMEFERPLPAVLPSFDQIRLVGPGMRSHLVVGRATGSSTESHLVVTGPLGGYIANGYTHFASFRQDQLQWYVNPFEFLRLAFATDEVPKPDATTVSGRRIYYSHIDGDGWRNQTEVPRYRRSGLSSAEVILNEVIEPFPDLPVTVGPIAGDLDPLWFGSRESVEVARRIFAVPAVEAGSHTYSHPLDWESLGKAASESVRGGEKQGGLRPVFEYFDRTNWPLLGRLLAQNSKSEADDGKAVMRRGHSQLRSYNLYPFNLNQEIQGSIDFISRLLPPGKHVEVLQWSGTTLESEAALAASRAAKVRNINGGDTRFDPEYPSYAWVAPLGRQVGQLRQVYSSASNENTYTNLWNERFFGFRYLPVTLRNTESPVRVKPFNLYYHMFSGEKLPSLNSLIENLKYARSQQLAPIPASRYAAIVDGFYATRIMQAGERRWRIENRGELNTIRFDHADGEAVHFAASAGVVGQRHYQGSLYVALDPAEPTPIIALTAKESARAPERPYLVDSRWEISKLKIRDWSFEFEAHGFGPGEMSWQVRPGMPYIIRAIGNRGSSQELTPAADGKGRLLFTIVLAPNETARVEASALERVK